MPLPSDKVIGARLPSTLRQLGALTCGPWNYAAPHIIRNDTDVRIIELEYTPVPHRLSTPADSPARPHLRRTHPAARKAKPVRMQIFVRFAFCHPLGLTRGGENQPVQESVTMRLRSGAQTLVARFVRLFRSMLSLPRETQDNWLTKNTNLHLWEENIRRLSLVRVTQWNLTLIGLYFKSKLPLLIQLDGLMMYKSPVHIFKGDIFLNTAEYIY